VSLLRDSSPEKSSIARDNAEVTETSINSRTLSTRKLNALKWQLFVSWCEKLDVDPVNCPVSQEHLTTGLALATLKV